MGRNGLSHKKSGGFHKGAPWSLPDDEWRTNIKRRFMSAWGILTNDPIIKKTDKYTRTTLQLILYGEGDVRYYEDCIIWGDTMEGSIAQRLEKGDKVVVYGVEESSTSRKHNKEFRQMTISCVVPLAAIAYVVCNLMSSTRLNEFLLGHYDVAAPADEFESTEYDEDAYEQEEGFDDEADPIETPEPPWR